MRKNKDMRPVTYEEWKPYYDCLRAKKKAVSLLLPASRHLTSVMDLDDMHDAILARIIAFQNRADNRNFYEKTNTP